MSNLYMTPVSTYTRHSYMGGSAITVTGTAKAGTTVRVVIVSGSAEPNFNNASSVVVPPAPAPVPAPGGGGSPATALVNWTVEVPVNGLPAGAEYVICADNSGQGKFESQEATIN